MNSPAELKTDHTENLMRFLLRRASSKDGKAAFLTEEQDLFFTPRFSVSSS